MKMMQHNTIGIINIIIIIIFNVIWLQSEKIECSLTTPTHYDPGRRLWEDFEGRDTGDWKLEGFRVSSPMVHEHIPFDDHTEKSEDGHFAIIDSRYTKSMYGYLEAENPYSKQTTRENICFSFWYFLYGHYSDDFQNDSQLEVILLYDTEPIKHIYRSLEDLSIRWQEASIDIPIVSIDFDKIRINGTVFRGTLAIDDLNMKIGYCISKTSQFQSDFEDGSSSNGMFLPDATWKIHQGSESVLRLPDHTTRTLNGHFYGIYMASNSNPTAKITTKTKSIFKLFSSCLIFSYYLIGENVSLFYGVEYINKGTKFEKWIVNGKSASNQWMTHKQTINQEQWGIEDMRLVFGIQFTSAVNNHAAFIDDVKLMKMSCGQESQECDFEGGNYCTLEVVHPKPKEEWISYVTLANTYNLTKMSLDYLTDYVNGEWHVYTPQMEGPYINHDSTTGNRYGNYFLFNQISQENRAILITDRYTINITTGTAEIQNFCLKISVVKPTQDSYIEVYQSESPDRHETGLKLFGTHQAFSNWQQLQIMARPQYPDSMDIYFFIVATTLNPQTYVAVDDFLVQQTRCPDPSNTLPTLPPPTGTTPSTTTEANQKTTPFHGFHYGKFYCNQYDYIAVEKVCDQIEDCLNGLDEKECGDCTFEDHNLCDYQIHEAEQNPDHFQWRFTDQSKYGPNDYHQQDSMTASGTQFEDLEPNAWLISPYIEVTYLGCLLDFYYFYNTTWTGSINDRFRLKLRTSDWHSTTLWQSSLEPLRSGEWYPIRVHLNRITHEFRLIFDALPFGPQPRSSAKASAKGSFHSIRFVQILSCKPKTPMAPSQTCYGFLCKNRVCIDKHAICDFDDDCGDGSDELNCDPNLMTDFQEDTGLGRWGETYFRKWKLLDADKQTDLRLAPTFDHTTRFMTGGKYLLSKEEPGAIIDGPPMQINSGCRISLFFMKNSRNSTLMMKLLDLKTGTTKILSYISDFSDYFQNTYWMAGSNTIYNSTYKILLETTLSKTSDNFVDPYVAVDDISFSSSCTILDHDPFNVTTKSPNNTCLGILCMDPNHKQICVQEEQICDFIPQCADGLDESQCGDCNFNQRYNLCGWTQSSDLPVTVVWSVYQPASATPNRFIKKDGDGNPSGGYLASEYYAHKQYFKDLKSPQINGRTSENCKMTFQYSCLERIAASIYVDYNFIMKEELNCLTNQWQTVQLDIGAFEPGFNIFVKIRTYTADEIVEIDNFKLHNCSTYHQKNDTEPQSIKNLDCDFETDVCGWIIGNNSGRSDWFRTNLFSYEPGIDHTSQIIPMPAKHGTWLSTQANIRTDTLVYDIFRNDKPILAEHSNNGYCMRFWYYYFGLEQAKFYVYVGSSNPKHSDGKTLWTRTKPIARDWTEASIDIPHQDENFNISMVAIVPSTVIVGLDDISFSYGPCPVTDPKFCDFELNLCNWKLHSGNIQVTQDGITSDHTTDTIYGHFLEQPMTQTRVVSAIIQDIHHENRQQSCLNLYYYFNMQSNNVEDDGGQLSIQLFENDEWFTLRNISMTDVIGIDQQNTWTLLSVSFWMEKHASLMIQITQNQQSILIDDVRYLEHFCDSFSGDCDFETDMCGWFNGKQQQQQQQYLMLWLRVTPKNTFVRKNGIPFDHTTKTDHGFYLALALDMHQTIPAEESVSLRSVLITRLQRTIAICFRMFYFAKIVSGHNNTEVMRVQLVDPQKQGKVLQEVPVVASSFDQHKEMDWILFEMEVENLPPVYEFVIVAKHNPFIISDIGIDDISIKHERCFDHSNTPFISTTPLPDSEKVADCDFEPLSEICHWKYQPNIWTVTSYDTQNDPYAPAMDHTTKSLSGHYLLYKNDTNKWDPSEQWFNSPSMAWDRVRCLSFWYYADGGLPFDVGQIDVWLQTTGEVCRTEHLNQFRFLHTQSWQLIRLTIPFQDRFENETMQIQINYQLFTQSQNTSADFSSFAFDDIRMRPGKCGHQHDYIYTFTDGVEDLLMEQVQPSIGTYSGHVINYRQATATKSFPDDIPQQDHTTYSSDYGLYLAFLNLNTETLNTTYVSDLSMVDVPADHSQRSCIRFAYQAVGRVSRSLKVYISDQRSDDETTSLGESVYWSNVAEKPWWTVVELDKQIDFEHRIVFRMIKPFDHDSVISLDDLTVLNRQCQQPFDCDFNKDHYCSYTDYLDKMTNQAFRIYASWMANIHPDFPGPSLDHSGIEGNGYLMLTGWRSSAQSNPQQLWAKMVSGSIELRSREPENYCLGWWSWINEVDASIVVNLLRFKDGKYSDYIPLATIDKVIHTKWAQTLVTLNESFLEGYEEIQLLLEAEINDSPQAFIALDDIELSKGVCPQPTFKCLNNKILSIDQRCDFRQDCPSGWDEIGCGDHCTFETDWCGWSDIGKRDMDRWQLESVVHFLTVDPEHAPKFDASGNKTGHYVMVRRHDQLHSETGHAEMALNWRYRDYYFKHSWKTCMLHFDYYTEASERFYLKARFGDEINNLDTFYILAPGKGSTSGGWTHVRAQVGLRWSSFLVDFNAFDDSIRSIIAVDNVDFVDCETPKPLAHGKKCPSETPILCNRTRLCIEESDLCNGINDCGDDAEDESSKKCGFESWNRCSFESFDKCEMEVENDDDSATKWIIATGHQFEDDKVTPGYEPLIDNTRRSRNSPYALLKTTSGFAWQYTYSSTIFTPAFQTANLNATNPCRLRFFYYWHSDLDIVKKDDLSLEVYVQYLDVNDPYNDLDQDPDKSTVLWKMDATEVTLQQSWNKAVVNFPNWHESDFDTHVPQPFRFGLRAWIKKDPKARLAIDDLSYGFQCQRSRMPTSPTINPIYTTSTTANPNSSHARGKTGIVVMSITIIIVVGIILAIIFQRKYYYNRSFLSRFSVDGDRDDLVMSMNNLRARSHENQ